MSSSNLDQMDEPMEDPLGSAVQSLPEHVSEGFPLMEGDVEIVPSQDTNHSASYEEPEDRLEKLLGRFEDKKKDFKSPTPEAKARPVQQSLKDEILERLQGNGTGKRRYPSSSEVESDGDSSDAYERRSPVKRQPVAKSFKSNVPVKPIPKKYPPLSKMSPAPPKKPALQAIINDLRKEIEKENDTSKIDLPVSSTGKAVATPSGVVKRRFVNENDKVTSSTPTPVSSAIKKTRGYTIEKPQPATVPVLLSHTKPGPKPEVIHMKQHKQVVADVMREMSHSGMHTDTVMIAGGQKISVHRLVLAASSPFLKSILVDHAGEATIILPETPYEDLAMLIDYVYCGESVVPEDRLSVILHLMSVLGFHPPVYSIKKGKTVSKPSARPVPRPVCIPSPERYAPSKSAPAPQKVGTGIRAVARKIGGKQEEPPQDTLAAAVRHIDDNFAFAADRKIGACWIRQITRQEALIPRKRAIGRKIEVKADKPSKTVIKQKEPFDRHKPRKVVIQRLEEEGQEKADDVNAALALTSLGGQQQQSMSEDLDAYQEGSYPESMLNSLLNSDHHDQGGPMSMPSLDAEDNLPDTQLHKSEDEHHLHHGQYMLEDGTIIQGSGIDGLPIATEGADGTTYILVMEDDNQQNLDLNQVIQGLSGGGEGNQAMLRIEEDGSVSYAATEDQADGGIYSAGDDENGLAYAGMSEEGFDGQQFEGQEYQEEGYDMEGDKSVAEFSSLPPVEPAAKEEGSNPNSDDTTSTAPENFVNPVQNCEIASKKKRFQCWECTASFGGMDSLSMHIARVHSGVPAFQCLTCDERFHTRPRLKAHKVTVHADGEAFVCHCGAQFFRKDNLSDHMRRHVSLRPWKCDTCERTYANKVDLLAHERSHKNERPFACTQCPKTFNMLRHLKLHVQRMHVILDNCELCDARFHAPDAKLQHDFLHRTEFMCIMCQEKCNEYVQWCAHMMVHSQYVCIKCGVISDSQDIYNEHSIIHELDELQSSTNEKE